MELISAQKTSHNHHNKDLQTNNNIKICTGALGLVLFQWMLYLDSDQLAGQKLAYKWGLGKSKQISGL